LVACRNRDLERGAAEDWFREDLYFRLKGAAAAPAEATKGRSAVCGAFRSFALLVRQHFDRRSSTVKI